MKNVLEALDCVIEALNERIEQLDQLTHVQQHAIIELEQRLLRTEEEFRNKLSAAHNETNKVRSCLFRHHKVIQETQQAYDNLVHDGEIRQYDESKSWQQRAFNQLKLFALDNPESR